MMFTAAAFPKAFDVFAEKGPAVKQSLGAPPINRLSSAQTFDELRAGRR